MSELARRILSALTSRSIGEIVPDDEIRQSVGSPELIEYSAACYELKEAGYLEMVIGMKWRIRKDIMNNLQAMLAGMSELFGQDLSAYTVYGSPMRPMSGTWARIDGAVYMPTDKATTGYHTYVAVPDPLALSVVANYELVFVGKGEQAGE